MDDHGGDSDESSTRGDFGVFEKHTKGIGMKLLKKMGYRLGGGLGKNEQGMAAPIEATPRPRNTGIGFNGCYYRETAASAAEPRLEESKEKPAPNNMKEEKNHWLKNNKNAASSKKGYCITADGLLLQKEEEEKPQAGAVPLKIQLDNLEYIENEWEKMEQGFRMGTLTLGSLVDSFWHLKQHFHEDYKLCNLSGMACSYARPLFSRLFHGWDPLQNPTLGLEAVSPWKDLLWSEEEEEEEDRSSGPYTRLFMEVVFPAVRRSSRTNSWQARDPEPMLRFLESWENLLPPAVLRAILDKVVLPKLLAAVDVWDPREREEAEIPIHSWIHPWLPLLGHKLETCYPTIRSRLASALDAAWHPSDESAYSILSPWKTVFDPNSWEELMVKLIVPKLSAAMEELQVTKTNPGIQEKPDQFEWVQKWATLIPTHHLLLIWDIFFNKWQDVLSSWLCGSEPVLFEEVTEWFLGWKNLLPRELVANEHIRYRLGLGLEMMIQAAQGLRPRKRKLIETTQKKAQQHGSITMKEVIETHAEYNGLVFKPKPGRIQKDGHQIYGFGNISIIIDFVKERVYAQIEEEGRWSLVCLEQLLELHNQYGLKKRRR